MYLYYRENGDVVDAKLESEAFLFDPQSLSTIETISIFEIDEVPENKDLIRSILLVRYESDEKTGLHQLYIDKDALHWRADDSKIVPTIDQEKATFRTDFQTTIDELVQIMGAPSFTAAQIETNIKFLSSVLLQLLKVYKSRFDIS